MRLLIIRHAIAVPRGEPGIPDADRRLTEKGRRRFEEVAAGLVRILQRPDRILTSPLRRAVETAAILSRAWEGPEPEETEALAGGSLEAIARDLSRFSEEETVALVGHEPWLSDLVGHLVGAASGEGILFKKGGAALLEIEGSLSSGGVLLWHLPPRILRSLCGSRAGRRPGSLG